MSSSANSEPTAPALAPLLLVKVLPTITAPFLLPSM